MRGNLIAVVCEVCCGMFVPNNISKSPVVDNFVMNMAEFKSYINEEDRTNCSVNQANDQNIFFIPA
jgi:hypothetical protein